MSSRQGEGTKKLYQFERHHRCLQAFSLDQGISADKHITQQDFEETMRKWGAILSTNK